MLSMTFFGDLLADGSLDDLAALLDFGAQRWRCPPAFSLYRSANSRTKPRSTS